VASTKKKTLLNTQENYVIIEKLKERKLALIETQVNQILNREEKIFFRK
jgi:hypothetical protein